MKAIVARPAREITDRVAAPEAMIHGRRVTRGTELSVEGIRGRVTFVQRVIHESGAAWLDVLHIRTGRSRSVRLGAVKTVHRSGGALG